MLCRPQDERKPVNARHLEGIDYVALQVLSAAHRVEDFPLTSSNQTSFQ